MNISEAITRATETLRQSGVANPRREASSLLSFVLRKETVFLIAHTEYILTTNESVDFEAVLRRRAAREPLQYITGKQEFYGLEFEVGPGVLIPRPETEILVDEAIAILRDREEPNFYEIGVGSGCIAVSILHELPQAAAVGVDISKSALSLAKRNAERLNVSSRLTLHEADLFAGAPGRFDLIVSNPPYIPEPELGSLQAEVGRFEPHTALFGGPEGLDVIERLIRAAPPFLKACGFLLVEIGFDQSSPIRDLLAPGLWKDVEFLADLQDIPRVLKARAGHAV